MTNQVTLVNRVSKNPTVVPESTSKFDVSETLYPLGTDTT